MLTLTKPFQTPPFQNHPSKKPNHYHPEQKDMPSPKVLIIGAGPVGLTTALSLTIAGVPASDITIADERPSRAQSRIGSRGLSASASTIELFRTLGGGAAEELVAAGMPTRTAHFGGGRRLLELGYDVLGTRYPFNMLVPQVRTEEILLRRCEEVGVRFAWGRRFEGLVQGDEEDVCATFRVGGDVDEDKDEAGRMGRETETETETEIIRAAWLVGCDGTGSRVRQALGIAFDGTAADQYGWLADGHADEDAPVMLNLLDVGGEGGRAMLFATGEGRTGRRFMGKVPASRLVPGQRPQPPDLDSVREWAVRNFGSHYNFRDLIWTSVVGDGMRSAASLRAGRVFLAGDAAHQLFPAGGQGLNTGLLDASNLAWKLGMVITGRAGADREVVERVLDSYTLERLPAVRAVEHNVRMQTVSLWVMTERERAVSDFMAEALDEPALNKLWARRVCGFADPVEPYHVACAGLGQIHELVGTRMTHISDESSEDILEASKDNMFVVGFMECPGVTEEQRHGLEEAVQLHGLSGKVRTVGKVLKPTNPKWNGVATVLIRPDLRVAWVAREGSEMRTTEEAITRVVRWWVGSK